MFPTDFWREMKINEWRAPAPRTFVSIFGNEGQLRLVWISNELWRHGRIDFSRTKGMQNINRGCTLSEDIWYVVIDTRAHGRDFLWSWDTLLRKRSIALQRQYAAFNTANANSRCVRTGPARKAIPSHKSTSERAFYDESVFQKNNLF